MEGSGIVVSYPDITDHIDELFEENGRIHLEKLKESDRFFKRSAENCVTKKCEIISPIKLRPCVSLKPIRTFTIGRVEIKCSNEKGRKLASCFARPSEWMKPEDEDKEYLKKEEPQFLQMFHVSGMRAEYEKCGHNYQLLDEFLQQNLTRESLQKAIIDCILENNYCTVFDKGGMYILGEYKSEKEMYCVWKLPKKGYYAIETDASFQEKYKAGSSVFLVRDCTGQVVYARRCVSEKYNSSVEYEAAGILDAMKYALMMDLGRVEVRSDCKSLIEAINGTCNLPENAESIIRSIIRGKKNFESIEFHFVYRGVNRAADSLTGFRMSEVGTDEEWLLPEEGGFRVLNGKGEELPKPVIYHCEQDEKGSPQRKQKKKKRSGDA